jgi:hypothetical protein
MLSKVNSPAYMDVSAAAQNQPVPSANAEESGRPYETPQANPAKEAKTQGQANPIDLEKEMLQQEIERIREANKANGKNANILAKCMRIAMRIVQGDNVPPRDDKFLAEHNPELHMRAWMLRVIKADPEDHESELDDEDIDSIDQLLADIIGSFDAGTSFDTGGPMPEIAF